MAGALPRGPWGGKPAGVGAQRGAELGCSWGQQAPPPQEPGAQSTKSPALAMRALSPAGEPPPAPTFPMAGAESSGGSRTGDGGAGLSLAGCGVRRSGPQLHPSWARGGAGGGDAGQVAAACPGWAGAERGFGRSEPPPRGGGAELKSRAERAPASWQATREGGRALPGLRTPRPAPRSRATLRAGGCGDWRRRRPSPCARRAAASRSAPPRPPSPRAPRVGEVSPERAEWSLRWGLAIPVLLFLSVSVAVPFFPPGLFHFRR